MIRSERGTRKTVGAVIYLSVSALISGCSVCHAQYIFKARCGRGGVVTDTESGF